MLNFTSQAKMLDSKGRPYFLWDMDINLETFKGLLHDKDPELRAYMLGKLMRQGKPDDVFQFVTLKEIQEQWQTMNKYLGRTHGFWKWLLDRWEKVDVSNP